MAPVAPPVLMPMVATNSGMYVGSCKNWGAE